MDILPRWAELILSCLVTFDFFVAGVWLVVWAATDVVRAIRVYRESA